MATDALLGKRFDMHLCDGSTLDIRVQSINPGSGQVWCHILEPGRPRGRGWVLLPVFFEWMQNGTVTEAPRP